MKAFPQIPGHEQYDPDILGMDLRDYFAAKAMQGLLMNFQLTANLEELAGEEKGYYMVVVRISYKIADEMIKEREKK